MYVFGSACKINIFCDLVATWLSVGRLISGRASGVPEKCVGGVEAAFGAERNHSHKECGHI